MHEAAVRLSVIIVNWNVRELLRACLHSVLRELDGRAGDAEIIVVDNASSDGSAEMVAREFPGARLIANAGNVGFGAANNQGFAVSRGRFVLLLNPDTIVLQGAFDRLLDALEAVPEVAALGCRLLNADGTLQKWTAGAFPTLANVACHYLFLNWLLPGVLRSSLYLDRDLAEDTDVDWVSGACMLLRRERLGERIFDEAYFMYGEDMDLCQRLRGAGWRVRYTPRASIIHYQGASMRQQQGDLLLSSLKGPRQFFGRSRPRHQVLAFDALTVCGFFLRWVAYGAAATLRPHGPYRTWRDSSRSYLGLALRVMRES
jgi:N-acetylglucosaminyl-diphospho-decaprenol L-rhamnosyltransferase